MPADLNLRRTKPTELCNLISLDKQEIDGELEMLSKQKIKIKAKNQYESKKTKSISKQNFNFVCLPRLVT